MASSRRVWALKHSLSRSELFLLVFLSAGTALMTGCHEPTIEYRKMLHDRDTAFVYATAERHETLRKETRAKLDAEYVRGERMHAEHLSETLQLWDAGIRQRNYYWDNTHENRRYHLNRLFVEGDEDEIRRTFSTMFR